MQSTTAGTIILAVLGMFVLYKILVWIVPVPYEAFRRQVIHDASFMLATSGLRQDEIYTKEGEVRSNIQKKADAKETELTELHEKEASYIQKYLKEKKLINKYGNTRKILSYKLVYALYDYVMYDRKYIYRDLESDIMTYGITPEQFFDLKKTVKGDIVGVYVIYNADKKMYYVGQAKRLYFRVWQHLTGHGNGDVYADYKYGNRFIIRFVTLNESGCNDLDMLERNLIQYYNAFTTGYNKTVGNGYRQTTKFS